MARLSSRLSLLVAGSLMVSAAGANGRNHPESTLTCDPAHLRADSYRLSTEAQALNLTRPRTRWWDAFDVTLGPYHDALADINEGALVIAERALAIDDRNRLAHAQIARQLVVLGEDGERARAEIDQVFGAGGAIVWTATLYDVDAHDYFLMAFDAHGIRVYRFGEAAGPFTRHLGIPEFPGPEATGLWRALGGCLDGLRAEAEVPWDDVDEIKAGNFVIYFKFGHKVRVSGDRGKTSTLNEFKTALHGAMGTVEYLVSTDTRSGAPTSVRGIGIGPTSYQDRVRRMLVAVVDPAGRIKLPKTSRGAGW
jgi:hypothetical protein